MQKPDIYDYIDCSLYLQAIYNWRRQIEADFSFAVWTAELGFSNKTILRFILQGKRRISPSSSEKIKTSLNLTADETLYFDALVAFSQARTPAQKNTLGAELIKIQRGRYAQTPLPAPNGNHAELAPIVLTLLSFSDIQWTTEKLSAAIGYPAEAVHTVLTQLNEADVVREENGIYTGGPVAFRISDQFHSSGLRRYYEHWLDRSKSSIDLPAEVRRYRSLMVALDQPEFDNIVEKINAFALELLSQHHTNEIKGKNLYMLNTALFPLTSF